MLDAYSEPIQVIKSGGFDDLNRPLPSAIIDTRGAIQWGARKVTDARGEEAVSIGTVTMNHMPDLSLQDRLKINGKEYGIIRISHPGAWSLRTTKVSLL